MGKFIQEFKDFAVKGNAVDMAVGVIIVKFTDLKYTLPAVQLPGIEKMEAATINYGNFLQTTLDFIIIAFCVFLLVKGINKLSKKKAEEPAAPAPDPEPTAEEKLLTEIRDLLKKK